MPRKGLTCNLVQQNLQFSLTVNIHILLLGIVLNYFKNCCTDCRKTFEYVAYGSNSCLPRILRAIHITETF